MFSVAFEVHPKKESFALYLELAKDLKPILQGMDGFVDNERFESILRPGWILSHSTWRDEKSVIRWRTTAKHHITQLRGRDDVFRDYRLRVGEVIADSKPPIGIPLIEQHFDETEVGTAKYITITEVQFQSPRTFDKNTLPDLLRLEDVKLAMVGYDVSNSIYNEGKLALVASWQRRSHAEKFAPLPIPDTSVRHRVVRVVREYGMFDRRETPQYYPEVAKAALPE